MSKSKKRSKKKASNGEQIRRAKQASSAKVETLGLSEQLRARLDDDPKAQEILREFNEEFLKMFERVAEQYAINIEIQKTNAALTAELRSVQELARSIGATG